MINIFKALFPQKSSSDSTTDDSTLCLGQKYKVTKNIHQNGDVEILVLDKQSSSTVYSKILSEWYIDNSDFPEAVLSSQERYLIICGYYYNPILIIDLPSASVYWEIDKFKDIYEFAVKNDKITIKDCINDEKQIFKTWEIDIQAKEIVGLK